MIAFEYIDTYKEVALQQMATYRIPASVILAQAMFESGYGVSALAKRSNNHFGIKCHTTWEGDTVAKTDDSANECFRKYPRVLDSYADHSLFLSSRPRYANLFSLALTDYRGWCRGLKEAGYATHPGYADELIRIIEQNMLYLLDAPEVMLPIQPQCSDRSQLRCPSAAPRMASLSEFSERDLLFSDERDFVLRSLRLAGDAEEDSPVMARK